MCYTNPLTYSSVQNSLETCEIAIFSVVTVSEPKPKTAVFSENLSDTETAVFGGHGFGFNQKKQISM